MHPRAQSRTVLLDTSILVADWLLRGPAATFILRESSQHRLRLVVPELVIKEAAHVYERRLTVTTKKLHTAAREHRRVSLDAQRNRRIEDLIAELAALRAPGAYEQALRDVLDSAQAEIAPVPDTTHEQILDRAFRGRRPFDIDGRAGYRDALIWETVLRAAAATGPVALVTANSTDFAASRKRPQDLADDLQYDLAQLRSDGRPDAQVTLYSALSELIKDAFPPEEQAALELRTRLRVDREFRLRVAEQLDEASISSTPDLEAEGDIGAEWEDQELEFVNEVRRFDVDFTSVASKASAILVQLTAEADIQLRYTIKPSLDWHEHPPEILQQTEWNERSDSGTYIDVVPASLTFQALYTPEAPELEDLRLTAIRESWEGFEDGRVLGEWVDKDAR